MVDLLYERLPSYCFLCGCFDHIGLGCQRYTRGRINASKALYGSWLQAEVKQAEMRNLQGHHFGLGEEDVAMEFEMNHQPFDLVVLVNSSVGSALHPDGIDSAHAGILSDDFGLDLHLRNVNVEYPISNREGSHTNLFSSIPDLNLDVNDTDSVGLGSIPSLTQAHAIEANLTISRGEGVESFSPDGPLGLPRRQMSLAHVGLEQILAGPNLVSDLDLFNLSSIIKQIMGSPTHTSRSRWRDLKRDSHGRRCGVCSQRSAVLGFEVGVKRSRSTILDDSLVSPKRLCILHLSLVGSSLSTKAANGQPCRAPWIASPRSAGGWGTTQ